MDKRKKVLLLCSSHNDLGTISALRKLGFFIISTGNRKDLPGEKWVDKFICADYSDKDLILKIAKEEGVDNICACCNDFGVYTAAYVAEKLNLPGYDSYEVTLTLHNKDRFKQFARKNDILSPVAESFHDADIAFGAIKKMNLPVIVKPIDCSAGNGVSVVKSTDEASVAIEKAFSFSRASRIVIEPFLVGTQHGFCTFIRNQKVISVCTNNEYSFLNPYRVEIDTFPATDWEKYSGILIKEIEKIAAKLKLKDGIFHLQYIVSNGKPWILEVMRRTIGNMYHVLGNELNGLKWEYWETRARCGMDCNDFPLYCKQEGFYAYKAILASQNGIIDRIIIPKEYDKYIFSKCLLMKVGDEISDYKNQPIGFVFMMFSDEKEMHKVLVDNYRNNLVLMKEKREKDE